MAIPLDKPHSRVEKNMILSGFDSSDSPMSARKFDKFEQNERSDC